MRKEHGHVLRRPAASEVVFLSALTGRIYRFYICNMSRSLLGVSERAALRPRLLGTLVPLAKKAGDGRLEARVAGADRAAATEVGLCLQVRHFMPWTCKQTSIYIYATIYIYYLINIYICIH